MGVSCKEVRRDLSDYIDEELEPFARVAFETHVKECRECAALLDGTRNVIRIYRDARVFAMPDDVRGRLQQRIRDGATPSRRAFLAWTLSAAATIPIGLCLVLGAKPSVSEAQSNEPFAAATRESDLWTRGCVQRFEGEGISSAQLPET